MATESSVLQNFVFLNFGVTPDRETAENESQSTLRKIGAANCAQKGFKAVRTNVATIAHINLPRLDNRPLHPAGYERLTRGTSLTKVCARIRRDGTVAVSVLMRARSVAPRYETASETKPGSRQPVGYAAGSAAEAAATLAATPSSVESLVAQSSVRRQHQLSFSTLRPDRWTIRVALWSGELHDIETCNTTATTTTCEACRGRCHGTTVSASNVGPRSG